MKKPLAALLVFFLFSFLLTGCWDRREINELTFVVLAGVDKEENGDIKLTMQIPTTNALKARAGGQGGGGGPESAAIIIESRGKTIFDAIRNAATFASPPLFWAHLRAIVFSQEVAREGIAPYMDFFARDSELRGTVWIVVTPGKAEEIVKAESKYTELSGEYIDALVGNTERVSVAPAVNLENFLERLVSPKGGNPLAPRIEIRKPPEEKKKQEESGLGAQGAGQTGKEGAAGGTRQEKQEVLLEGSAVFKRDKMLGWLSRQETRGLLWLQGKVQGGLEIVKCPGSDEGKVVEEIIRSKTKIDVKRSNQGIVFLVKIQQEGNLGEQTCSEDFSKLEKIQLLEKAFNKEIEREARVALRKLQEEYNSDIIGLGGALARKYPKIWEKMDWEKEFSKAKVIISVDTQIRRSGMILQPPFPKM